MDNLRQRLAELEPDRVEYVYQRSKTLSDKAAYEAVGISRSKFYTWPEDERNHLSDLANALRRNRVLAVEPMLQEALDAAVKELIRLATQGADRDSVQLSAIQTLLDRTMGKVTDKVESNQTVSLDVKGYQTFDPSLWDSTLDDI